MDAEQRLGMYRLVERLGRGGFAEVWRARPEPATAFGEAPAAGTLSQATKALAALLRGARGSVGQAPGVLLGLAEQEERLAKPGAPPALVAAHADAMRAALRWVEELAAGGDLDVAVKVPFHDGWVRQLRREKDVLLRIEHPRLVRQLELDLAHEPPFLAMELVRGWSLRDALKSEPRPPVAKVLAIMDQLLTVLDHLHRRGVVHGDVKPENILLEPDGALRLIDLGLGQVSQAVLRDAYLSLSLASRVPILGTLSYMAPEVRKGRPAGPASDLYSAGIVLYEMLVGDVPHGMTLPSDAVPERELSPRFDVLLKWVLHPDPHRRVPSAAELRERLLVTLRERPRHQYGSGRAGAAREGTHAFDQWALGAASPFVAGDWVGPWQLEAPLGRGGFGEVWKAKRGPGDLLADGAPPGPDHVALKIALGPHGKEGLEREAEVGRRLSHPRIPAVRDAALAHDPPYLVVDFASGRSLRSRLVEDGPLEPAELVPALASLVSALVHCHAAGVVHRDLKPENLLLDEEEGALTLLDFGLATCPELEERQRVEVSKSLESRPGDPDAGGGTFEYMAPERRRGAPGAPPADAYAVGVIVFELLTGELPRGLTRLRELRPLTPPWLEALVAKLLDPAPDARPSLLQVQARLGSEGTPARQRLSLGRRGLRLGPHGREAAGVVAACAAGVVAAAVFVGLRHDAQPTEAARIATAAEAAELPAEPALAVTTGDVDALRRGVLQAPATTADGLRALREQLAGAVAAAASSGLGGAPLERRLEALDALLSRRVAAEVAAKGAEGGLADARALAAAGDEPAALAAARAAHQQADRALELDPGGPATVGCRVTRVLLTRDARRWSAAAIARRARAHLADPAGGAGRADVVDLLPPGGPDQVLATLLALPDDVRPVIDTSGSLAAAAEAAADRGDLGATLLLTSARVVPLLDLSARARVDEALARVQVAVGRAQALRDAAASSRTPRSPAEELQLLERADLLAPAPDAVARQAALLRAEVAAAGVGKGERRRRARGAVWRPLPDGPALAFVLAGDDLTLRAVALALLGDARAARALADREPGLLELRPLVRAMDEAAVALAVAEAAAPDLLSVEAPDAEAAARAIGLARVEREVTRQALRDAADPLP